MKREAKREIIVAKDAKSEAKPEITVERDTVVKKAKSEAKGQKRGGMSIGDARGERGGITIGYARGGKRGGISKAKRAILAPRRAKEMPKVKRVEDEEDGCGREQSGRVKRRHRRRRQSLKRFGKAWCQVAKRKVKVDR